uniref:Enolpyruvate transferase domain-containing protein n=1 Tax=Solanum lycopersicum TaxID=4081 RepID=A0A3Q7HXK7_SOLLC
MDAPLALGDVEIEIIDKLISVPYVEMTLKLMERFGVFVEHSSCWNRYLVKGGQKYKSPGKAFVEGDASSASYFFGGGGQLSWVELSLLKVVEQAVYRGILSLLRSSRRWGQKLHGRRTVSRLKDLKGTLLEGNIACQ